MAERSQIFQSTSTAAVRTDIMDTGMKSMSIPALWEKSFLCPCRNKATRQPNQSCNICHGRGIGYLPPAHLDVLIGSQEKGVLNNDIGLVDSGTAIATPIQRDTRVSFRDRITIPAAEVRQSFIFDVTARRIKKGFHMVYDVKSIEYAVSTKGELVEGEDYTVDKANNLFFPKENLEGKMVSINITTTLRYMVADLLKEHRYARDTTGALVQMPQKLLLKREDVFVDKEAFDLGVNNEEVGEMIDPKRPPSTDGLNGFFSNKKQSGGLDG
jgi:hypothetical protein